MRGRLCSHEGVLIIVYRVSLKTKLSAADLHRLINDVRRRVEYEVTFEGKERRIKCVPGLDQYRMLD